MNQMPFQYCRPAAGKVTLKCYFRRLAVNSEAFASEISPICHRCVKKLLSGYGDVRSFICPIDDDDVAIERCVYSSVSCVPAASQSTADSSPGN